MPEPVEEPHLSWSQLQTLADCGEKFRLSYVVQVPRAPQGPLIAGRAIHAAIEWAETPHEGSSILVPDGPPINGLFESNRELSRMFAPTLGLRFVDLFDDDVADEGGADVIRWGGRKLLHTSVEYQRFVDYLRTPRRPWVPFPFKRVDEETAVYLNTLGAQDDIPRIVKILNTGSEDDRWWQKMGPVFLRRYCDLRVQDESSGMKLWDSHVERRITARLASGTNLTGFVDAAMIVTADGEVRIRDYKCLAGGTELMTESGPIAVENVQVGDRVLAWQDQRLGYSAVSSVFYNGFQPIVTVRTVGGRVLRVTEDHPCLVIDGWKPAGSLRAGDLLRVGTDWEPQVEGNVDHARFLGLMAADGTCNGSVKWSKKDQGLVEWMRDCCARWGLSFGGPDGKGSGYWLGPKGRVRDLLGELYGHRAATKRVPSAVWQGGPAVWLAFLSGYFDGDGSYRSSGQSSRREGGAAMWSSQSRGLLSDCQTLLAWLGIRSSVVTVNTRYKGEPYVAYRLVVRDRVAVRTLAKRLTLLGVKRDKLAEALTFSDPNPRHASIADRLYDTVAEVSVAPLVEPTIGIEVADCHTHITEGLVTHNSGAVGRGSPMQLAIYAWLIGEATGLHPSSGEFVYLRADSPAKMVQRIDGERFARLVALVPDVMARHEAQAAAGVYPFNPSNFCQSCNVKAFCAYGRELPDD